MKISFHTLISMQNNSIGYANYEFEDFILDDSFVNFAININQNDIKKWEKWFSHNPKNKEAALKAKTLIAQLRFKKHELSGEFVNDEWQKLKSRLNLKEDATPIKARTTIRRNLWVYAAAASILLLFASAFYYFTTNTKNEETIYSNEIYVAKGEIKNITLPDGSQVFINSDSKLKYSQHFGQKQREVYLEGEAWFDVKHNEKIPFVVHTQENDITDLGTAFNIYAYPDEDIFRASLERGKISISQNQEETMELKVNQTYVLFKNTKEYKISETENIQTYSSWKEGETVFRNQPFSEILRELERTHNVKFNLLNKKVASIKYTGTFSAKDDINTILKVIKLPMAFEYEIVNDSITIK